MIITKARDNIHTILYFDSNGTLNRNLIDLVQANCFANTLVNDYLASDKGYYSSRFGKDLNFEFTVTTRENDLLLDQFKLDITMGGVEVSVEELVSLIDDNRITQECLNFVLATTADLTIEVSNDLNVHKLVLSVGLDKHDNISLKSFNTEKSVITDTDNDLVSDEYVSTIAKLLTKNSIILEKRRII